MSLFNQPSQPSGSSSQQPRSLFGGTLGTSSTTQPQPTTGGLFSGLGTSSTVSSQPPPPRNLFASLGSSQPASSQPASLFNLPPSSTQPQQPILGFGATQNPQQNNPQEVRNPNQQTTSQPAFFDTLLERSRQRNKDANGVSVLEELPSLQLGLGDIARRLKELGGAGLAAQQGNGAAADKAHYILAASGISTGAALRDLNALNVQASSAAAASASRAIDTDIDTYLSTIQSQSTLALIADGLNRSARDFDVFLEKNVTMEWEAQRRRIYEHFGLAQRNTASRDDENDLYNTPSSARGGFGRPTRRGWAQGENANRSTATGGGSVFGASTVSRSVIGSPSTGGLGQPTLFADLTDKAGGTQLGGSGTPGDRFLREKQTLFMQTVGRLNQDRLTIKVFPVLSEFANAELKSSGDPTSRQLVDAYRALIEIVKENPAAINPSDPDAVKERQFANDYLDENPNSARSIAIKKRNLDGSRTFLEKSFYQQLETLIAKHPKEALIGGVPTVLNKVRAYIKLRNSKKDLAPENVTLQMLGSDHVWALIFYLLRSGHAREAAEFVTNNAAPFRNIDRNFVTYITDYVSNRDRRLRRELQNRINAEYSQRQRIAPEDSIDPFRMACYKVIGRCDLNKRSLEGISQDVEDWIWLQFSLAREVNRVDEVAGEVFGLDELRAVIKEIGQRHFAKGQEAASGGIGTYFFLQILAGMFEQAIAYLYPYQYIDAVHFAIGLDFYGLLRVSNFNSSDSELLTFNTKQLPQIDFGRMIGYYTRDFRAENVEAAVDYLTLICLNADLPGEAGRSQASLCHGALRELVLETREFAKLLGDVRADGVRISGAIEQRLRLIKLSDQEEYLRMVTKQAAGVADDNGRVTDAVLLYHLAEDYDNVISIINKTLSEAIATDFGQEQLKLQPLKPRATPATPGQPNELQGSSLSLTSVDEPAVLARNMVGLYNSNAMYFRKISQANRDACGILLRMSEVKALVEGGHWAAALDIITSLNILPLSAAGDVYQVRSAAHAFPSLHHTLARNVGNLLMWTITCCGRQRDLLRASNFDDATKRAMAEALLVQAKDLMVYAGMIKYKLPPNVYEALARAGQEVGAY